MITFKFSPFKSPLIKNATQIHHTNRSEEHILEEAVGFANKQNIKEYSICQNS
jgi:hypothetical protein